MRGDVEIDRVIQLERVERLLDLGKEPLGRMALAMVESCLQQHALQRVPQRRAKSLK